MKRQRRVARFRKKKKPARGLSFQQVKQVRIALQGERKNFSSVMDTQEVGYSRTYADAIVLWNSNDSTTANSRAINVPAPGAATMERVGRQITLDTVTIQATLKFNGILAIARAQWYAPTVMLALCWSNEEQPLASANASEVFINQCNVFEMNVVPQRNMAFTNKYTVLAKKLVTFTQPTSLPGALVGNADINTVWEPVQLFYNLRNRLTRFKQGFGAGNESSIEKGSLFLVATSNYDGTGGFGGANRVTMMATARITYYDK